MFPTRMLLPWLGALVLTASAARAQSPAVRPGPSAAGVPAERVQVMCLQPGFEDQQQGYLSKVQGAASANVHWVIPQDEPRGRARAPYAPSIGWDWLLGLFE